MQRITECTCGKCNPGTDQYGNADYGNVWSARAATYVPRNCPVAQHASRANRSIRNLVLDGYFKVAR